MFQDRRGLGIMGKDIKVTVQGKISIRSQSGPKSIHVSTGGLFISLREKRTNKMENGVGKDKKTL